MYVPPQRVMFLRRFGLKTGIDFPYFGLEGFWFSRERRECMNVLIVSIPNEKKEREICEFEMDFKKSFLFLFLSK